MEKKKSKTLTDLQSDNQIRIKKLLQDLEKEFDFLLNENAIRKKNKSIISFIFINNSLIAMLKHNFLLFSSRAIESSHQRKWNTCCKRKRPSIAFDGFRNLRRKKTEIKVNSKWHKSRV